MTKRSQVTASQEALDDAIEKSDVTMSSTWMNPLKFQPESTAQVVIQFPDNEMRYAFLLGAHSAIELPSFKDSPLPRKDKGFSKGGRFAEIDLNYLNQTGGLTVRLSDMFEKSRDRNQHAIEAFIAMNLLAAL